MLVNYRHEQDIYVRMIDSVTKQVCISLQKKISNRIGIFSRQLFMKVKIKIPKCAVFY